MHNYVSPDPNAVVLRDSNERVIERKLVSFDQKIDYCLSQGVIPFLFERKGKKNDEAKIIITANILHEIKKYQDRSRNNNGINYTLAALASEIPGFKSGQVKINNENNKAVFGPKQDFCRFVNPTIEDTEAEI